MFKLKIPSRPVRYAIVWAHTLKRAVDDIEIDLANVERGMADRLETLSASIDALQLRLERYEEQIVDTPNETKAKAKRAGTRRNSRAAKK